MASVSVRLRNKASGAVSAPATASWSTDTPNPDYGRDLRTWVLKSGGQELVLPDGTYSASTINAGTAAAQHSQWLVLRATTPGGVVVNGFTMNGVSRVMFVGMRFTQRVQILNGCDRLAFWYCEHSAPLNPDTRNGMQIFSGTNIRLLGMNLHDCSQDGLHISGPAVTCRAEGYRVWNISAPAELNEHNDAYQTRSGSMEWDSGVFGLDDWGAPSGNGHVQVQSDGGPAFVSFRNHWSTASGNYGFTTDTKGTSNPAVITVDNVRSWGHQFGDAVGNGTFSAVTPLLGAPLPGEPPPDVVWRTANPYGSYASWLSNSGL